MSVRVFLSYSLTKSHDVAATRAAVERARTVLSRDFGWEAIDAMDPDLVSIATKVRAALLDADCVIADVSASTPNVMFEVGFAKALGYPVLLLLNFDAFDSPRFRDYFAVLGQSEARPTPADLGDIEYLVYPSGDAGDDEWRRWEGELARRLALLRAHFTPEVLLLRRGARGVHGAALDFLERNRPSNPILGFLGGHLAASAEALADGAGTVFVTLGQHYVDSMKAFAQVTPDGLRTVRAVADLGASPESIWDGTDDPLDLEIRERVFILPTALLVDPRATERLARIFHDQGRRHPVLVVHGDALPPLVHPVPGALGRDVLVMEPDLVAAYVPRRLGVRDEPHLLVRRERDLHADATAYYDAIRDRAFAVHDVESGIDLVRRWLAASGIGRWRPSWPRQVENRPPEYFREYDLHVRCWIPAYEHLVCQVAESVSRLLLDRLLATGEPVRVLEAGVGTGALTVELLRWLQRIDAPRRAAAGDGVVERLVAVDPALPMLERARGRVAAEWPDAPPYLAFAPGRVHEFFPPAFDRLRFDVVCGSLVLHEMLDGRDDAGVAAVLRALARRLRPGGALVFADCFPARIAATRAEELATWTTWMTDVAGLAPAAVEAFLAGNPEIVAMRGYEELLDAAHGFAADATLHVEEGRGAPGGSPWRVVTLGFPTVPV